MSTRELQITVQSETKVVSVLGEGAQTSHTIVQDDSRMKMIEFMQDLLKSGTLTKRQQFEFLGTLLYDLLFGSGVKSQFEATFKEIRNIYGERLRLRLHLQSEAGRLTGLPWEYLYCPASENREGFFLATETHLVLTRYIPLDTEQVPDLLPLEQDPLRILVVVSQPTGLGKVLHEPVIEAISKLGERSSIQLQEFHKPTVGSLRQQIEEYRPHILHFIGHGEYDESQKQGKIALLNPDDSPAWKTDHDFTMLFQSLDSKPRLIVLQACEGAVSDFVANFAGLAPKLMRAETPAVVAMQHPITNRAASVFSRGFYEVLARGYPVDDAVQEGRREIVFDEMNRTDAYSSRSFGTPVLHMNSKSGIILVKPGLSPDSSSPNTPNPLPKPVPTNDQLPLTIRKTSAPTVAELSAEFKVESRQPSVMIAAERRDKPAAEEDVWSILESGLDKIDELQLDDRARGVLEVRLETLRNDVSGLSIRDIEQHLKSIRKDANPDLVKVVFAMILAARKLRGDDVRRPAN